MLHDIGKAYPSILPLLLSSSPLDGKSRKFRKLMESHPELGVVLAQQAGIDDNIMLSLIRNHHRRQDGSGYPLEDNDYPTTAFVTLLGLIDAVDAIVSYRLYNKYPNNDYNQALGAD